MAKHKISPLLVIVGETASGKSTLALQLAQRYYGEIICADSWTVRREANIGSAKPTAAEQALVPHHLLDVAGPNEDFTAAVFKRLAERAINDIANRGKLPIMVGGTGLYIDSVLFDYGFLPAGDRQERQKLNAMTNSELINIINNRGLDLTGIDTGNKRRLIRLIETNGQKPTKKPIRPNTLVIGIRVDKQELEQKINDRVDKMIKDGLEGETRALVSKYGWDCEALKGVGYAQWRGYFDGQDTLDMTRQKIIKATLDLAKRQRTWFKRNKGIQWITTPVNHKHIDEMITTNLDSFIHY